MTKQATRQATTWMRMMFTGVLVMGSVGGGLALGQGPTDNAKDELFAGTEKFAQGATGVNEISMDPDSLGMVNGDHARRAHRMVLNVVRSYEYDKPGMYRMEDVDTFRKKLETGDWHCSVHTRDLKHGDSTDVCHKRRTDGMVESAIITVAPKSLTFIHTVRKADDGQSRDGMPSVSGTFGMGPFGAGTPGMAQLAMIEPMLEPMLGSIGPMLEAHMVSLGSLTPGLQADIAARMAAMGPEMAARMAEMGPRLAAEAARMGDMAPRMHGEFGPPFGNGSGHGPAVRIAPVPHVAPMAPVTPKLPE